MSTPLTPPTLRTARLVLRPWRDADRAPFAALNADPEVMEHFPAVQTAAESDAAVERFRDHFTREAFGLWAVETADAPFIGFAGLARPAFMPGVVEIGLIRDPDADFDHPNIPAGHRVRRHWLFRLPAAAFRTHVVG